MEKIIIRMAELKDVFISYEWSTKSQVMILEEKLKKMNFKVWRDERDFKTSDKPLTIKLANAIKKSKLFVCCITESYCKSYNCNLEIELANNLRKPMLVLMVDRLSTEDIAKFEVADKGYTSEIGFIVK